MKDAIISFFEVVEVFICVIFIFALLASGFISCSNSLTEAEWNDGICPKCEQVYELKAAGMYGLKYYVCPECHTEVERY